jgi:hypothetical protein
MEAVLYIWLVILYLWLACPSKTKQTVGNQEIELIEIPIVKLQYQPKIVLAEIPVVQLVYKETTVDYSVLTVAQLRKVAQSYHIKGARSMRKAELLESLSQH